MYFEPGQFPDELPIGKTGWVNKLGFDTPPGGKIGSPNHVLNDHTYCCQLSPAVCAATGEPDPKYIPDCKAWHEKRIGGRTDDAKRLGVPLIMSEFGACMDSDACVTEINQVADVSDEHLASWAYWEFKTYEDLTTSAGTHSEGFYNFDGTLQQVKVKALSRTYVKAAQGTIQTMKFTPTDADISTPMGHFTADIKIDLSIDAPSVIHAAQVLNPKQAASIWYEHGFDYTFEAVDTDIKPEVQVNTVGNEFQFKVANSEFNDKVLRVTITPKSSAEII